MCFRKELNAMFFNKKIENLMKKFLCLMALSFATGYAMAQIKDTEKGTWTALLDKDLSQWETYLSYRHKNGYNGKVPLDEKGDSIVPVGYNKNEANVFSMVEENGQPVLKVSGEIYGCVFTKQEYENYHLKLKVKWGNKKWEPRKDKLLDAGVIYHSQGQAGVDYWRAWMLGQEFQIMEGHMGDYWSIANSAIDVKAFMSEGSMSAVASERQSYLPIGSGTGNMGYCMRSADYETADTGYTTIELICFNGKSLHIVNGHVVMVLANSRYWDGKAYQPLVKGKIQMQSEAAEVYYKEVLIKTLTALPKEYAPYFDIK